MRVKELLVEDVGGQQQRDAALHASPHEAHPMSLVDPLHDIPIGEVLVGLHCCGKGVHAVA